MTPPDIMKAEVAAIVRERLGSLAPLPQGPARFSQPGYNRLREALLDTEAALRNLVRGSETERHEWLAVIHYALADERARLLSGASGR